MFDGGSIADGGVADGGVAASCGAVVDALVECGRVVAHSQARLLAAMVAVADRSVGVGFDADEVAFALHVPRMVALREVVLGRDLMFRLPAVFASLDGGRIDLARARVFSELLSDVDDDGLARSLAGEFLASAEVWTASQLRSRLRRAVLAADPDAAGQRYERSVAQRRVQLTANPDTSAHLAGVFLPAAQAAAGFERVDAVARGLKNDGDLRTLDQLRADVFCGLLAGTLAPGEQQPVHRSGVVELLVPLATLTGHGGEPGVLGGYGPVVADIARQVAAQAAERGSGVQWRFRVYGSDGTLLHHGITRARPQSGALTRPQTGALARPEGGAVTWPETGALARPDGGAVTWPETGAVARPDGGAVTWRETGAVACPDGGALTRPETGAVACPPAQADEAARFASPALRRWIAARDGTCRAPGCTAPARVSDVDHTVEHAAGGKTRHDNLGLLCRHHHRLKHEGGFRLAQPRPGMFVWTSPNLTTYTTDPDPPW